MSVDSLETMTEAVERHLERNPSEHYSLEEITETLKKGHIDTDFSEVRRAVWRLIGWNKVILNNDLTVNWNSR